MNLKVKIKSGLGVYLRLILGLGCKVERVVDILFHPEMIGIGFYICHFSLRELGLGFEGRFGFLRSA